MSTAHRATAVRGGLLLVALAALLAGCERPPIQTTQEGFRGTGMVDVQNPRRLERLALENAVPAAQPPAPAVGPAASAVYQNVQVLGGVPVPEFARLMLAITSWVSPQEGCNYCHDPANLASDAKYTKVVSRRMLQMTQDINANWKPHVAATGVTCYTCHRGQAVPSGIWFDHLDGTKARFAGNSGGQNRATAEVGLTSLPLDPFSTFLLNSTEVRRVSSTALPTGNRSSIKQTEWTYALMMHMSQAMGVNCTYCHNSRSFTDWSQSRPQRATAWHAIRMVRGLNNDYLNPLQGVLPPERLGPAGDAPKVNCTTCHKGVNKPLLGVSMLADYAVLAAPVPPPPPPEPAPAAPAEGETAAEVAPAAGG